MGLRTRARSLLLPTFAFACLALGNWTCGHKGAGSPTAPLNDRLPLSDGDWRIKATSTPVSGDSTCIECSGTRTDTIHVVGGIAHDPMFPHCAFDVSGNRFRQACTLTLLPSIGCQVVEVVSGSGTFSSTAVSATYDLAFTSSGTCDRPWNCRVVVLLSGQKLPTSAGRQLTDDPGGWWLPGPCFD
jgi:hypothetical protein